MTGSYAVVCSYSFDDDVSVYLCNTEEDAVKQLTWMAEEEYRIDTEENGWDSELCVEDEGWYGSITTYFKDGHTDITEFRVGRVYQ